MHKKAIKYIDKHFVGDVSGKTIIITGGNAGIGYQCAEYGLYLKMRVILACRNQERAEKAVSSLKEMYPDGDISYMLLDVSEKQSIINFVNEIKERRIDIDVFYHNAGIFNFPYQLKEGKDLTLSTNYFGPFLLTSLLLPYLKSLNHEVKMIITSSLGGRLSKNKIAILHPTEKSKKAKLYFDSKMLDAHMFHYLDSHDHDNVKYYLVHPGITATALISKAYKSKNFIKVAERFTKRFCNPLWKSCLALTCVLSETNKPGTFYGPTHLYGGWGYPKEVKFFKRKYKCTDEFIKESENILGINLLK